MGESELKDIIFEIGPDDVIATLLLDMPNKFRADDKAVHETITGLSEKWPDLFGWFEVTSDYPFRFSRCLEEVLDDLGENRLISALNPSFTYYSIDEAARNTIRKFVQPEDRFTPEQRAHLKEAARLLAEVTAYPGGNS